MLILCTQQLDSQLVDGFQVLQLFIDQVIFTRSGDRISLSPIVKTKFIRMSVSESFPMCCSELLSVVKLSEVSSPTSGSYYKFSVSETPFFCILTV